MKITALAGNPKAKSKTYTIAEEVAGQVARFLEKDETAFDGTVIDLADYTAALVQWGHPDMQQLLETIASSDVIIVASPTYKATYTGLLKLFIDSLPPNALDGKFAVPVMVGGAPNHSLAVDAYLRPLLIEVGATCPTKGLYVLDSQMEQLPEVISKWVKESKFGLSLMV